MTESSIKTDNNNIEDDASYPNMRPTTFAFGSCHKNNYVLDDRNNDDGRSTTTIWEAIGKLKPDTFLWTGDAVYPPPSSSSNNRSDKSRLSSLQSEYQKMLTSSKIGYAKFLSKSSLQQQTKGNIHGTWDDHDFGGNDLGHETLYKNERLALYLQFLGLDPKSPEYRKRIKRNGLYSSITFGKGIKKVKVLFLDTRWSREKHCIPSIGSSVPYIGAPFSCITRWITAGLSIRHNYFSSSERSCMDGRVLNEEQWKWLENQLKYSDATVHIIVSSIQVLTTNPVVESWGHFPKERTKLLKLLHSVKGLVLLSGDVHHGEILEAKSIANAASMNSSQEERMTRGVMEVTSSGLTHSCQDPIYGFMCQRLLDAFSSNRFRPSSSLNLDGEFANVKNDKTSEGGKEEKFYYTGRNFGSFRFDWGNITSTSDEYNDNKSAMSPGVAATMTVNVHNHNGSIVLSTGPQPILYRDVDGNIHGVETKMTWEDAENVPGCIDGHLLTLFYKGLMCTSASVFLMILILFWRWKRSKVSSLLPPKRKVL